MSANPKYQSILLAGLAQAFAGTGTLPLLASRTQPGLFPATALGKAAAHAALEAGYLTVLRTETKGKTTLQYVSLSVAGSTYLFEQTDPKPLLQQVLSQLEHTHTQAEQAMQAVTTLQTRVQELVTNLADRQITQTRVSIPSTHHQWEQRLAEYLQQRQQARPAEDCPLPELFQQARQLMPDLTVGSFHDSLRRLQASRRIALQPWTGPLHEMPEPNLALMQGHSLAFYASCPA